MQKAIDHILYLDERVDRLAEQIHLAVVEVIKIVDSSFVFEGRLLRGFKALECLCENEISFRPHDQMGELSPHRL